MIGTHRVLSKDVEYKDLGLLIIDEEQRFGVADKEKVKKLKTNVDVLTLSATPIPRTLHMSLAGIRDMSVLEEPPIDRLPIQTYVCEYDEEMVRAGPFTGNWPERGRYIMCTTVWNPSPISRTGSRNWCRGCGGFCPRADEGA